MKDLFRRLERLEHSSRYAQGEPIRIVRKIVGAIDGRLAPWNPTYAYQRNHDDPDDKIMRTPGEAVEAFEDRARAHFTGDYIIG